MQLQNILRYLSGKKNKKANDRKSNKYEWLNEMSMVTARFPSQSHISYYLYLHLKLYLWHIVIIDHGDLVFIK